MVRLIFLPDHQDQWTIKGYHVGLWNVSDSEYLYHIQILITDKTSMEKRGELGPQQILSFSYLEFSDIERIPIFQPKLWQKKESKLLPIQLAEIKIKAKQFFSKLSYINSTETKAIVYELKPLAEAKKKKDGDLQQYTLDNIQLKKWEAYEKESKDIYYKEEAFDLEESANFINEIDLHMDQLVEDPNAYDKQEKYKHQIGVAKEYLEEAIRLKIKKIFLIHGIGKGRLKGGINELLHKHPQVRKFKNEYHPKYGYGATEVDLK